MVEQRGPQLGSPPTAPQPAVVEKRRRPWPLVLLGVLLLLLGGAGGWLARGAVPTPEIAPVAAAPTSTAPPTPPPVPVAGPPIVPTTNTAPGDGPLLGRAGARPGRGIGVARPAEIDGEDGAVVTGVTWEDWGEDRATGRGTALYRPGDEPDAPGVQDRATVIAFDLGSCGDRNGDDGDDDGDDGGDDDSGDDAYQRVTWYFPQHGESFRESRAMDVCG
ncbi:hypothetical protein WCD74_01990 [Actinomycetospora sp. OC33-EN08]|uniref:Serine/threonine protein kinase n=1 Tax=Actinomycetospora aurantiaca TaxID=3129233 RepID=A0ABU8MHT4_9PSEU